MGLVLRGSQIEGSGRRKKKSTERGGMSVKSYQHLTFDTCRISFPKVILEWFHCLEQ